jgi:short-subunit dehydrogenase
LINISSLNGAFTMPYMGPYCASKAALEAISDALRVELRTWRIAVSVVEPGPIATPIWGKSVAVGDQLAEGVTPDVMALYENDLAEVRKCAERLAATASSVERVVQAVVHALTAKRPKTRYFLGWPVRFMFRGFRMAPDRIHDWLARRVIGLTNRDAT